MRKQQKFEIPKKTHFQRLCGKKTESHRKISPKPPNVRGEARCGTIARWGKDDCKAGAFEKESLRFLGLCVICEYAVHPSCDDLCRARGRSRTHPGCYFPVQICSFFRSRGGHQHKGDAISMDPARWLCEKIWRKRGHYCGVAQSCGWCRRRKDFFLKSRQQKCTDRQRQR